jgi:hypothetical protein
MFVVTGSEIVLTACGDADLKDVIEVIRRNSTSIRLLECLSRLILLIIGPVNINARRKSSFGSNKFPETKLCTARACGADPFLIRQWSVNVPIEVEITFLRGGQSRNE